MRRETRILQKRFGCRGVVAGKEVIIFSSNDYLGLSGHPDVISAALQAAKTLGIGTGGAPGTTGTTVVHKQLEAALAKFVSRDKVVLFPSGYQANIAIHQALASDKVVFHLDKRHHPSAVDGARLGEGAEIIFFDHNNLTGLENGLKSNIDKTNIVSIPSVFTIDGDIARLDLIAKLKEDYRFILILDEAHATGVLGDTGRGLEEHFNLHGTAEFIMGSFSKALGSQGGFLAYNKAVEPYLTANFRQFEYSTSLSAVSAAAVLKIIEIIGHEPGLLANLRKAKEKIIEQCLENDLDLISFESMILLLPCENSVEAATGLLEDGFFLVPVKAIVNNRRCECLRITPMALHKEEDIALLAKALKKHVRRA